MKNYRDMMSLKGKHIIVTGGVGLLGSEVCKGIASFEGTPIICDVDEAKASKFIEELKVNYNVEPIFYCLDITSEISVAKLIEMLTSKGLIVSGLVNCAYPRGLGYGDDFFEIKLENWNNNVNMHLGGYFHLSQKIAEYMRIEKTGSIVNFSSIYGLLGPDFSVYEGTKMTMPAEYSAIKGAINNFSRYLATRLSSDNIRVNVLTPGGIYDGQPESFVEKYSKKTPLARMGNPEDIVGGVLYLLSDLSSYVTGQNIIVDGGWSVW